MTPSIAKVSNDGRTPHSRARRLICTGIRSALLEGDVDKALKLTRAFYPDVLKENENIYFQLRRRKFIEMIKQSTDLQAMLSKRSAGANGHTNDHEGVFDHQMELDEQLNGNGGANDWEKMDTGDGDLHAKANQLTQDTILYGQELLSEFSKDPRREVKQSLETAFALMAYQDPKDSPLASMLDDEERVAVAEDLNSAILGTYNPPLVFPTPRLTFSQYPSANSPRQPWNVSANRQKSSSTNSAKTAAQAPSSTSAKISCARSSPCLLYLHPAPNRWGPRGVRHLNSISIYRTYILRFSFVEAFAMGTRGSNGPGVCNFLFPLGRELGVLHVVFWAAGLR